MKPRWKITVGLVALGIIGAVLLLTCPRRTQRQLEQTRRSLRQQGFKIDLSEFNLSTSPEERQRAALLATTTRAALTNQYRPGAIFRDGPELWHAAGPDAAVVVWKQAVLRSYRSRDLWAELREEGETNRARIDSARAAAVSGLIRFEPIGGPNPLLPYLADLKGLATTFATLTLLTLHDGDQAAAWTNLLASTCLVTAYVPEPITISHLVRLGCAEIAYDATWNALQSGDWTEAQLAELQRRWEAVDLLSGLAETAAFSRAETAALCELERRQPIETGVPFQSKVRSPTAAWYDIKYRWNRMRYRHEGSYEDETTLLLYYRDRELELRNAIRCPTWSALRQLPGVTNFVPFASRSASRVISFMNLRQVGLAVQGRGQSVLGRAAEAETRRRIMLTAIALERFHRRHGSYPTVLDQLAPELLPSVPADFMDGKPLRYRLTADGHFVLYSVGLDCVDNGGALGPPKDLGFAAQPAKWTSEWQDRDVASKRGSFGRRRGIGGGSDLVWPRPASAAEAEALRRDEARAEQAQAERLEDMEAAAYWESTARRQAKVESILRTPVKVWSKEPAYRGRLLSDVLRNEPGTTTNQVTLADLLALRRVTTGAEPETVTLELPLKYDVLTNLGSLYLCIDPCKSEDGDTSCNAGMFECKRATNGNCEMVWSTIYECPGKHALLAGLTLNEPENGEEDFSGPFTQLTISNLCQFSLGSAHFNPQFGVSLQASLPEENGDYTVELKSVTGELLKTIAGGTSNGVVKVHWDMKDERGRACTNEEFATFFHITLPDSGRTQMLRGP